MPLQKTCRSLEYQREILLVKLPRGTEAEAHRMKLLQPLLEYQSGRLHLESHESPHLEVLPWYPGVFPGKIAHRQLEAPAGHLEEAPGRTVHLAYQPGAVLELPRVF